MDTVVIHVLGFVTVALTAGFLFLYPRLGRRGLLFGAYVGPERGVSDRARAITAGWYRDITIVTVASLAATAALAAFFPKSPASLAPGMALGVPAFFAYLRAHRRARELGRGVERPVSVSTIGGEVAPPTRLPWVAMGVAVLTGGFALAHTFAHYPALPDRIPTHFGISGEPDDWSNKSAAVVFLMPVMAIAMGLIVAGTAVMTTRAKRALRTEQTAVSEWAQSRFRNATARFLSLVAIVTSVLLGSLAVGSIDVARGAREALGPETMVGAGALFVIALGGALYLAVRYGQGGARLEGRAAAAPLADGLADDRAWKLGLFYYAPDDPSFFVEHRFGLGYTVNFGNRWAVGALVGYLLFIVAVMVVAFTSGD
ncbi:MAG TPA: DUF1648 domain-containing protein [Candidatus Polarisedimenticolaceae bacterium]